MDKLQCRDHLLEVFSKAAKQRKSRNKWVPDPLEWRDSLEWVIFERQTMLAEVNRLRTERGLDPMNEKQIFQAEKRAFGHVDYPSKFALYCAELIVDIVSLCTKLTHRIVARNSTKFLTPN